MDSLRRVPTGPYSIDSLLLCQFRNDINIGVVIQVLAPGYFHERIGQSDEFSIGLEILGCGHGNELNGTFIAEFHVGPLTHGEDGFGRGHTVVGDEDLADGAVASTIFDVVFDGFGGRGRGGGWIEGGGIEGGVGLGNVGWSEIDTVGEGALDGAEDALGGLDGFGCEM